MRELLDDGLGGEMLFYLLLLLKNSILYSVAYLCEVFMCPVSKIALCTYQVTGDQSWNIVNDKLVV